MDEEVPEEELVRAKESVKGRLVLSQESMAARMARIAGAVLFDLPLQNVDEMIARIDAVTAEEVREIAADLYGPSASRPPPSAATRTSSARRCAGLGIAAA